MQHLGLFLAILFTIGASTLPGVSWAEDVVPDQAGLTLEAAVARALDSNPAVRGARVAVESAELARRGAGAPRANPTIMVEGGPRFRAGGPEADVSVGIQVPFDLGGTSRRRRTSAAANLDAARARLAVTELEVATSVRVFFAEAVAANGRVRLAADVVALNEEMVRVARRRHELGEVSILEPNFASLELAGARRALLDARVERARADRELRSLLALSASASLALSPSLPPEWPGESPSESALLQRVEDHPALVAARDEARTAVAELEVARGTGAPGLWASGSWAREGAEDNLVIGGLQIGLPLQRNQLGVADATRAAGTADIDAEAAELAIPRDLAVALEVWQTAVARHDLAASDALPLADENLDLVMKAYEVGREELLAVLLLQRQALAARRAAIDAELELHRAAAALERAVGQEIF